MPWSESLPQFSFAATVLGIVLLAYAAVGEPLLGRRAFAWLERRRHSDPRALSRFYALTIGVQWAWTAVIVVILVLSPGLDPGHLGLRPPDAWLPLLGAVAGFAVAALAVWLLTRGRGGPRRGSEPKVTPGGHVITTLAPRSRTERRLGAGLAVTAGVCEELLYRGLLVAFGVSLGLPVWAAAVLSCLLFALAHLYQGWWGLVGPGVLGALLMVLYLGTGSLLVPIVLHIALDMRALLLTGTGRRHRNSEL
ncbi:membrane protease YdiL (CAAX protease family) [Spinactinospora alkalitolerans]|uniref:Membrane protease YdiL (CAAX protease family) n=1 Tax=Spinactinospora alkalitolerans TaxID=687207 RepID=A0A852U048_9ACTN|nr:CPBP family intramembrane glutamic endopeptidase [Spinactinospora alkalitolerans]NYE49558.1 membrane protease YdiL (CAAX protease family) [Spinactinospora alkalitolerans]